VAVGASSTAAGKADAPLIAALRGGPFILDCWTRRAGVDHFMLHRRFPRVCTSASAEPTATSMLPAGADTTRDHRV